MFKAQQQKAHPSHPVRFLGKRLFPLCSSYHTRGGALHILFHHTNNTPPRSYTYHLHRLTHGWCGESVWCPPYTKHPRTPNTHPGTVVLLVKAVFLGTLPSGGAFAVVAPPPSAVAPRTPHTHTHTYTTTTKRVCVRVPGDEWGKTQTHQRRHTPCAGKDTPFFPSHTLSPPPHARPSH